MLTFLGASLRPWAPERISLPSGTIAIIEKLRMRKLTSHDVFFCYTRSSSLPPPRQQVSGQGREKKINVSKKRRKRFFHPVLPTPISFFLRAGLTPAHCFPQQHTFSFLSIFPGTGPARSFQHPSLPVLPGGPPAASVLSPPGGCCLPG